MASKHYEALLPSCICGLEANGFFFSSFKMRRNLARGKVFLAFIFIFPTTSLLVHDSVTSSL